MDSVFFSSSGVAIWVVSELGLLHWLLLHAGPMRTKLFSDKSLTNTKCGASVAVNVSLVWRQYARSAWYFVPESNVFREGV